MMIKYVLQVLHDLNIAQTLDFLGYFSKGFTLIKPIDFLASLRFEILQSVKDPSDLRIIVYYQNEILPLDKICKEDNDDENTYCKFEDFVKYFRDNLVFDREEIDRFCNDDQ